MQRAAVECPNVCAVTTPAETIACGKVRTHLHPELPAERMCYLAVEGMLDMGKANPAKSNRQYQGASRDLRLGWTNLELALHPVTPLEAVGRRFANAHTLAGAVLANSAATGKLAADAALLRAYLPAFAARREGIPLPPEDRETLRRSIGELAMTVPLMPIHTHRTHPDHTEQPDHLPCFGEKGMPQSMLSKLAVHLIGQFAGMDIYPASSRENFQIKEAWQGHDLYLLSEKGKHAFKVATRYQQRFAPRRWPKGASELIFYAQLVEAARARCAPEWQARTPKVQQETLMAHSFTWLIETAVKGEKNYAQSYFIEQLAQALRRTTRGASELQSLPGHGPQAPQQWPTK